MSYADFFDQDTAIYNIIKKHASDFTYNTYSDFMKRNGGFKSYVRSLGGIFAKWIDFNGKITTKAEFTEIMNYVWGLYCIWGVDYSNGCTPSYDKDKWKAYDGHGGAFYPTKEPSKRFNMNYGAWGFGNGTNLPGVETMLSDSKYYAVVNCGQGVLQAFKKAGLVPVTFPDPAEFPQYWKEHGYGYKIIKNASDLQVGDVLIFTSKSIPNKSTITSIPNWIDNFYHTAIIGKRDDKYIYMFDSGHAFTHYGQPINRRRIGDNQVYQWAADWIALRYDIVAKLSKDGYWKQTAKGWQYIKNGKPVTGWQKLDWSKGVNWFYFDSAGIMQTGFKDLKWSGGTNRFYFDSNGCMLTGWQKIANKWYYFESSGAMVTGLRQLQYKGKWNYYLFDANGVMQTGKVKAKVTFNSSGKLTGGTKV